MTDRPARVPAQASPSATAAYVRIYEEEQPRLVAYARSLTRNTWAAEDLVAEAHFRVWRRLSAGHEIDNVPAYLMTTVRHLASSVASATHETPRDPQIPEQVFGTPVRHADDPAEQVSATDLLVRVLGELPERWAQALWLADAEGQPLESVGRQIGAKQGATAVLLHRAREGMRQAFLRSQTEAPDDPACEVHWVRMPAYVRGGATPRQSERLLAHVDTCDGCRSRLAVLVRANNRLPALVGPALLVFAVGGGTGKVLASLAGGSAAAATAGAARAAGGGSASAGGHGLLRTARAAGPKTKAALASGTAAAAAVAVVLTLGVNESPSTVTSPGRAPVPVAQGPVVEPSVGVGDRPVRAGARGRDRTEVEVAVESAGSDWEAGGSGGSGGSGRSGGSGGSGGAGSASDGSDGSSGTGGGGVEQPAPEKPVDPVPDPVTPAPPEQPSPGPVEPAPESPEPPKEPAPEVPKGQQPEPVPEPGPEQPTPVTPGEEAPVPEPVTPTPAQPAPVGEAPESPSAPSTPPPGTGDDCDPVSPSASVSSPTDKGVDPA